ncbi:SDR family NAD(P)-dependent oxidoreductase [Burkholderia anthina]|uniref:SDR family NAD(P)-dependent oxidoreductase n=1 Tax=Burkholderia anthina TaxID=179879 RepID=UPI001588B193|nr:SDR family oxidoreductase [Burkholderia anthina]
MNGRLAGRIAVVSGGGAGIGQTIAAVLASQGADIAVADVGPTDETKALVEKWGRRFFGAKVDVSDERQVENFALQVRQFLGPVDIVMNNAAIASHGSIEETSFEFWQRLFSINVHGNFLFTRAFVEDVKRSKAGRIICMTSTCYLENSLDKFVTYVTSKSAINGFVSALACDLGPFNVTVNGVSPSVVRTPTTEKYLTEEWFAAHIEKQNLKRQQQPEDVANMVAYLASDEGAFITGQIMVVDGGLTRR